MQPNSQSTAETISQVVHSFMDKFIDWKEFERFIADIYRGSDEVTVQHNVTLKGKSGANRQIDVLITQKIKLNTVQILVECKSWKNKIDRPVVDVLAGALDDFPGSKGVIFTTQGYEEGAILLAKSKNIDIFLVRDVYEEEWGDPGRFFVLYLQIFASNIMNITSGSLQFISTTGNRPSNPGINFNFILQENMKFDEAQYLYSIDEKKGPHLLQMMLNIREESLRQITQQITGLIPPEIENQELAYKTPVILHFENTRFRYFKIPEGLVKVDSFRFELLQVVTQSKIELDRAGSASFVLMVENYVTKQRNFVSKAKDEEQVVLSEEVKERPKADPKTVLQNGSVAKVITDYFVTASLHSSTKVVETNPIEIHFPAPGTSVAGS